MECPARRCLSMRFLIGVMPSEPTVIVGYGHLRWYYPEEMCGHAGCQQVCLFSFAAPVDRFVGGVFWGEEDLFLPLPCVRRPPWGGKNARPGQDFFAVGYPIGAISRKFRRHPPRGARETRAAAPPIPGPKRAFPGGAGKIFSGWGKIFSAGGTGSCGFSGAWGGFLRRGDLAGTGGRATFALAFGDDPGARFFEAAAMRGAPRERAPRRWIATAVPGRPGAGGDFLTRESLILAQDER